MTDVGVFGRGGRGEARILKLNIKEGRCGILKIMC